MAGGGHGWIAPVFFSAVLFIAYPLVFVRTVGTSRHWVVVDIVLIEFAVFLDVLLVGGTYVGESTYFMEIIAVEPSAPIWIGAWIAIWSAWQLVTAFRLLRRFG